MANDDPLKLESLDVLHDAIKASIAAAFPDFATVEFYRDDQDEAMPTPACLLELDECDFGEPDDAGTGQMPVTLRFCARLIFSRENSPAVPLEVRKAGIALALHIFKSRWGVPCGPAQLIQSSADDFDPRLHPRFAIWRIEWAQQVFIGDTVWTNDGAVPAGVFVGREPDIGIGHEADYTKVYP